jgi:DNA-binding LytR/AlgR family response regulator
MAKQAVFFRFNRALKKINVEDIILIVADNNYVRLYAEEDEYMIRSTFETVLSRMPEKQFLRVHRTYAVSIDHIVSIAKDGLVLKDVEFTVPVSKQHYPLLMKQIVLLDGGLPETKKTK